MRAYVLYEERKTGYCKEEIFLIYEKAISNMRYDWNHLTLREKQNIDQFYLCEIDILEKDLELYQNGEYVDLDPLWVKSVENVVCNGVILKDEF